MKQAQPSTSPHDLAHRVASGASVHDMMRRGEIAGQALGLLQLVAATAASSTPAEEPRHTPAQPRRYPVEAN